MRQTQTGNADPFEGEGQEWVDLSRFVTFDNPGDQITGVLLGHTTLQIVDPATGEARDMNQFIMQDDDGLVTFNEVSQLSMLVRVPAGIRLQVTLVGTDRSSRGRTVKTFSIRYHCEDRPKVRALFAAAAQNSIAGI